MKNYTKALSALAVLSLFAFVACDDAFGGSPTEPTQELTVDFDCIALGTQALECASDVSGGVEPYDFRWQSTGLTDQGGVGASTVVLDYKRFCGPNVGLGLQTVEVKLTVTDKAGAGVARGPVTKGFTTC